MTNNFLIEINEIANRLTETPIATEIEKFQKRIFLAIQRNEIAGCNFTTNFLENDFYLYEITLLNGLKLSYTHRIGVQK
jgi:hypothetical protein